MSETGVMQTDLDRLTERVEKAAGLIQRLREEHARAERERDAMAQRLQELERALQGQDAGGLVDAVNALKREQREWQGERREVASRIEALIKKLERLET